MLVWTAGLTHDILAILSEAAYPGLAVILL